MNSLKLILAGGAAIAVLAAYQFAPFVGVNAQRHRLEASRDTYRSSAIAWHRNADGWKASFNASEAFRDAERTNAVSAIDATNSQCLARVSEARRSARAIRGIVERPTVVDSAGCAVRSTVSVEDLRVALGAR